jgi:Fe2+ transport system protein B
MENINKDLGIKLVKVLIENKDDYEKLEKNILETIYDDFLERLRDGVEKYEDLTQEEKEILDEVEEAADILDIHTLKMDKIMKYYKYKKPERRIRKMREGEKIIFYDDTNAINKTNNTNEEN